MLPVGRVAIDYIHDAVKGQALRFVAAGGTATDGVHEGLGERPGPACSRSGRDDQRHQGFRRLDLHPRQERCASAAAVQDGARVAGSMRTHPTHGHQWLSRPGAPAHRPLVR